MFVLLVVKVLLWALGNCDGISLYFKNYYKPKISANLIHNENNY